MGSAFGGRLFVGGWNLRVKNVILSIVSLVLVGSGVALIASVFLLPGGGSDTAASGGGGFNVPVLEESTGPGQPDTGPKDKTLVVSIPKMDVSNEKIPDANGSDEEQLRKNLGIHLRGTGFPWQKGANVYIAGHRLGFPGERSFLAFYDLDALKNGDEITITDADKKKYTYRVFRQSVVDPTDLTVTQPVKGKDILTLQTCTLPDYSQRLIVQAEKVA